MSVKAIEALRRLVDVAQKMNFVEEADLDDESTMMGLIEEFDTAVEHAEAVLAQQTEPADIKSLAAKAGLPLAWISETGVIQWSQLERLVALAFPLHSSAQQVRTLQQLGVGQMTDRELLELAAKAAGIPDGYWNCEHHDHGHGEYWNPLGSSENALWLAVKLRISIYFHEDNSVSVSDLTGKGTVRCWTEYFNDDNAEELVRRAIASLAAEIGKGME
jgi:hypothetical protein